MAWDEQNLFSTGRVRDWLEQLSPVKNGRVTVKDHSWSEYSEAVFEIRLTLIALMLKRLNCDASIEQLREMSQKTVNYTVDAVVPPYIAAGRDSMTEWIGEVKAEEPAE